MKNQNTINIIRDNSFSFHPLHDMDNLGNFALEVSNYNIGDRNHTQTLREKIEKSPRFCQKYYQEYDLSNPRDLKLLGEKLNLFVINIPVYGYLHSGLALSLERTGQFACPFDSGVAGFIYVTKDDLREFFGIKKVTSKYIDKATDILKSEFLTLKNFVEGDCFSFEVIDENGDIIDSCGGFIGNDIAKNGMLDYIPSHLKNDAIAQMNTL